MKENLNNLVKVSDKEKAMLTGNIKNQENNAETVCRPPACFCHCACWDKEQQHSLDAHKIND